MKKTMSIVLVLGGMVALVALLAVGLLSADEHDEDMMVEMSITNLTKGQVMSPVFVARHNGNAAPL